MLRKREYDGYNWVFDTESGFFVRWGKTKDDDPQFSPFGPEIADIEISTICNHNCPFCYKDNSKLGENMSREVFDSVLSKLPDNVMQIAYGIGSISSVVDLLPYVFSKTRERGIVPNITINGLDMTPNLYGLLATFCGAVSVSHTGSDSLCFDAIKNLHKSGLKQINIHKVVHSDNINDCFNLIDKVKDNKIPELSSLVFLILKPKGRAKNSSKILSFNRFKSVLDYAKYCNVSIGMDSCGAPLAIKANFDWLDKRSISCCDSSAFSIYVDIHGKAYPCSFTAGNPGWENGLNIVTCSDFIKDIWFNPKLVSWRNQLLNSTRNCMCSFKESCRACPEFSILSCRGVV